MSTRVRLLLVLLAFSTTAYAATPEEDAKRVGALVKPISDEQWKTIAGGKETEKYEIVKGDTLFDISKRLFGDGKYWPKIWALNGDGISNPHAINPGAAIAFQPGTGSSLPALAMNGNAPAGGEGPSPASSSPAAAETPVVSSAARSMEWQQMPKQGWENVHATLPAEVDKYGFDSRNKVTFKPSTGIELQAIASTERIATLGQIIGSRTEGAYMGLNDTVYIRADEEIQVGETYAITQEPELLKSRKSDRIGYSYLVMGQVKIIGVKDSMFVGTITSGRHFMSRGSSLMPLPPKIKNVSPLPAPSPIEGVLMVDRNFSTYTSAQHKQVYVDRGSDDGVRAGMVFRAYQHFDPSNERKITDSDFIIDADILVVQVSERFCTGIVINSISPITENSPVVMLTDVNDLLRNRGFKERSPDERQRDQELDDLDKLDTGNGLGRDEQRELQQLERWQENPPGSAPAGSDNAPPPPPSGSGDSSLNAPPPPPDSVPPPPDTLPAPAEMPLDAAPPPPPPEAEAAAPNDTLPALESPDPVAAPPPPEGDAPPPPPAEASDLPAPLPAADAPPPALPAAAAAAKPAAKPAARAKAVPVSSELPPPPPPADDLPPPLPPAAADEPTPSLPPPDDVPAPPAPAPVKAAPKKTAAAKKPAPAAEVPAPPAGGASSEAQALDALLGQ